MCREVVPMEELESVLNSSNGTVVTSILPPAGGGTGQEASRRGRGPQRLPSELASSGTAPGSWWACEHQPRHLAGSGVILHSMRGSELLLMTTTPDVGGRLLALLGPQAMC